jgi:hypothetical protein
MFTRRSSSPYRRDFFVFALVRNSTFSAGLRYTSGPVCSKCAAMQIFG